MAEQRRLYLFTASYPFDSAETFLEDEISFLAEAFDQVVITPLYGLHRSRVTPPNCVVNEPILPLSKWKRYIAVPHSTKALKLHFSEFFARRVWASVQRLKAWTLSYLHSCHILHSPTIQQILAEIRPSDICYFYWGKGLNLLTLLSKIDCPKVCRFHGEWDLWEESSGGYAPLREKLSKELDLALFISERGKKYYDVKYPNNRLALSRLGAQDYGTAERSNDGKLRIVSCSAVYPLKRVPLILQAVKSIDKCDVEWTHIGGGPDFAALEQLAEEAMVENPRLKINLTGQQSHQDVIDYYHTHCVDLFINMSTNEGIPVTIMEAISFGIPVIATNVGGTAEIVNEQTGTLLSADPSLEEITEAIYAVREKSLDPRGYWEEHYNAARNYTEFCEIIKSTTGR